MSTIAVGAVSPSVSSSVPVAVQTLLSANSSRSEAIIQNASTGALYIGLGMNPSIYAYSAKLYTDDVLTTQFNGQIFGLFAVPNGSAMVTELS